MNCCKKVKKLLCSYPFILGLLTAVLINFGGRWMVQVRELTLSEVSYTIVAKTGNDFNDLDSYNSNTNPEIRDIIVSESEVPVLDYDPGSTLVILFNLIIQNECKFCYQVIRNFLATEGTFDTIC